LAVGFWLLTLSLTSAAEIIVQQILVISSEAARQVC